jgi:hypothetical protein
VRGVGAQEVDSLFRGRRLPWWASTSRNLDGQESGDLAHWYPLALMVATSSPPRFRFSARVQHVSRVLFSFLSPFPLNCLRVCGLSLPLFLSPSLSHHLSLPPSMRGSGRVGRWRGGFSIFRFFRFFNLSMVHRYDNDFHDACFKLTSRRSTSSLKYLVQVDLLR